MDKFCCHFCAVLVEVRDQVNGLGTLTRPFAMRCGARLDLCGGRSTRLHGEYAFLLQWLALCGLLKDEGLNFLSRNRLEVLSQKTMTYIKAGDALGLRTAGLEFRAFYCDRSNGQWGPLREKVVENARAIR